MRTAHTARSGVRSGKGCRVPDLRPGHQRVRDLILNGIASEKYLPGQRLPNYSHLAEMAEVSEATVRRAVDRLVTQGWVFTRPGVGVFVADPLPGEPEPNDVRAVLADHEQRLRR